MVAATAGLTIIITTNLLIPNFVQTRLNSGALLAGTDFASSWIFSGKGGWGSFPLVCLCGAFELSSSPTPCFEEDTIVVQSLATAYKDPTVPVWHVLVEREADIKVECSNEIFILKDYSFGCPGHSCQSRWQESTRWPDRIINVRRISSHEVKHLSNHLPALLGWH